MMRTAITLEAHRWPNEAFDGGVVLFDDVVQVFDLPSLDRCWPICVGRFARSQIHTALIPGILPGAPFWSIAFSN